MYQKPTAPLSVSGVLEDGVRLWRASLFKISSLAVVIQILVSLPSLYMGDLSPDVSPQQMQAAAGAAALALPFLLGSVVISVVIYNAIIVQLAACAERVERSIAESLVIGLRLLPRAALLALLCVLATIAIAAPIVVMSAGVRSLDDVLRLLSSAPMLLSLLAALVLYTYLFTRACLANIVLVADNLPAVQALKRSWQLTHAQFWRCSTLAGLVILIFLVIGLVVGFVLALVALATSGAGSPLVKVISILVQAPLAALVYALWYALYQDLTLRRGIRTTGMHLT
jgi:hypothetical protein